jgi:spore germination protein KC
MLKKHFKYFSLFIALGFISLLFTGCWDYKDIEKRSLVMTIALDKAGPNKVRFDDEVAEFIYSTTSQIKYNLIHYQGEGSNFDTARIDIEASVRNELNNGSVRGLVIGENFARENGIEEYLNRINKHYDIRKTITLVISKCPTKELIETSVKENRSVGFFVEDNIRTLFQHSDINVNVAKAVSDMRMDGMGTLIPCIDLENDKIKYVGLAVIKDSKLIDIISSQNTTGILLIDAPKVPMTITLIDPKDSSNTTAFKLTKAKKKIKTYYKNDEVIMDLSLDVRASMTHQYKIVPQDEKALEEIEEALSKNLKNSVEEAIRKSQNDYKVDLFEFIKYFKAQHPVKYRSLNWRDAFPKAKINVKVNVNITDKNGMDYENKQKLDKR